MAVVVIRVGVMYTCPCGWRSTAFWESPNVAAEQQAHRLTNCGVPGIGVWAEHSTTVVISQPTVVEDRD